MVAHDLFRLSACMSRHYVSGPREKYSEISRKRGRHRKHGVHNSVLTDSKCNTLLMSDTWYNITPIVSYIVNFVPHLMRSSDDNRSKMLIPKN